MSTNNPKEIQYVEVALSPLEHVRGTEVKIAIGEKSIVQPTVTSDDPTNWCSNQSFPINVNTYSQL